MNATRLIYSSNVYFDHPRWCAVCGTQRGTTHGKFNQHNKPNGKPCENSGQKVNQTEAAG